MAIERWRPVLDSIKHFELLLASAIPPLRITAAVDKNWTDEEYKRLRPEGFPGELRGVYLIYDPAAVLQYVGLAMWSFDTRVWSHDAHMDRRWIDVIAFDDQCWCLAPALEFRLICDLHPPCNKIYRGY